MRLWWWQLCCGWWCCYGLVQIGNRLSLLFFRSLPLILPLNTLDFCCLPAAAYSLFTPSSTQFQSPSFRIYRTFDGPKQLFTASSQKLTHRSISVYLGTMAEAKELTLQEVSSHNTKQDLYMVVHDKVYDCSSFVDEHPYVLCLLLFDRRPRKNITDGNSGGEEVLLDVGGQDATEAFEDVGHSDEARELLDGMLVGSLKRMVSFISYIFSPPPSLPPFGIRVSLTTPYNKNHHYNNYYRINTDNVDYSPVTQNPTPPVVPRPRLPVVVPAVAPVRVLGCTQSF